MAMEVHLNTLYSPVNLAFYRQYCDVSDAENHSSLVVAGAEQLCGA